MRSEWVPLAEVLRPCHAIVRRWPLLAEGPATVVRRPERPGYIGVDCRESSATERNGPIAQIPGGPSVARDPAAVDVQDLTGNEGRRLQEEDAVDDVTDLAHVTDRGELVTEPLIARHRMLGCPDDAR